MRRSRRANPSYLALVAAYTIHPIHDDNDLEDAVEILRKLLARRKPLSPQERDYADSLGHEIERYEDATCPIASVSEAGMLRHLIEARGITYTEVARGAGIAVSTISEILAGKRELNRTHIKKLATFFQVSGSVFME